MRSSLQTSNDNQNQGEDPPPTNSGGGQNRSQTQRSNAPASTREAAGNGAGVVATRTGNNTKRDAPTGLNGAAASSVNGDRQIDQAAGNSGSKGPQGQPGTSRDSQIASGRPGSGKGAKIQMNKGINGIKGLPPPVSGAKQQSNGARGQQIAQPANAVTLGEDSPTKHLLNTSTQLLAGAAASDNMVTPFENNMMSPAPTNGQLRVNQNLAGGSRGNAPMAQAGLNSNPANNRASMQNNIPIASQANKNSSAAGSTFLTPTRGAPAVTYSNGPKIAPLNFGITGGSDRDYNGRQNFDSAFDALRDDLDHQFAYSPRRPAHSLRSSFDYIDVNMNEAMHVAGAPTLTGRASKFFRKSYKEDNWSGDESVFNKQMKMPNVNNNKVDYQQEIGLNLDVPPEPTRTLKTEERQDTIKEAREMLPNAAFYKIVKKDRIQIIDDYYDRFPLLDFRKTVMRWRVYINRGAQMVMMHSLFESISITVIVVNSLFLAMDDPLRDPSETPRFMTVADDIFQYLYTVEMVVKIVSLGFIVNDGSYLRDAWNILDFTIIASGYMGMFMSGSGANLSVLRSFRVIRPLRTISSVQGLRVIVSSLINAVPLLRDSILVLMFFFLIFAIAGCQLFTGALKNRCFHEDTGTIDPDIPFCGGGDSCRPNYYCGKSNENPSNGATNFDNVFFSLMQVFQIVTMEGWTAIMVALMQSVGTWIFIYFYPIIFIGAFFLLNLTLAVIKAKFTEEMNNRQEPGGSGGEKKKKLDDAPESSEDEDLRAKLLQEEIDHIKVSKQMSPRSKENLINKIKIEHLLWRADTVFDKKEIEHKIVERTDADYRKTGGAAAAANGKSFYSSAIEKIGILQPAQKTMSFASQSKGASKTKVAPALNYSDVFYSDKRTVFHIGKSPRENLKDIFNGQMGEGGRGGQGHSTLQKPARLGSPIREDDEEHDLTGLLEGEVDRAEALRRREARRRTGGRRPNSGGRGAGYGANNSFNMTQPDGKKSFGFSKFLGKVFEAKKEGEGEQKKLVFAGIKNNSVRPALAAGPQRQASIIQRNPQDYDENMRRQVYENITRNFDIFEFLDENIASRSGLDAQTNAQAALDGEGDDEMSDELEFQIDDDDNRLESLYFEGAIQNGGRGRQRPVSRGILDLEDNDEEGGSRESADNGGRAHPLKRGSTQATVAENGGLLQKNSSEQDAKFTSPFHQSMHRQNSLSPRDNLRLKKAKVASQLLNTPALEYKGGQKGFLNIFRACKRIKANHKGRDFRQEYLLLKKRARSQEAKKLGGNTSMLSNGGTAKGQSYKDEFETKKLQSAYMPRGGAADLDEKQMTVRAKSIESKRKRLLAESIRFQRRIDIMRKRRAQFFAPAIKMIGVKMDDNHKAYEDYVLAKRKIRIDPELIDEEILHKRVLYRNASSEALLRYRDVVAFEMAQPFNGRKRVKQAVDLRSNKSREGSFQLDSQRSLYLDNEYQEIVEKVFRKEEDLKRYNDHEDVPDFEDILQEKELKIVVKMKHHAFQSINDVFEKSGPGRFLSEREKAILEKERKKREALKMKLPKRIAPRDLIIGYQKKIFVDQKQFHEELLKNEFQVSDEDQDGMLARIEDEYNQDHRSHIFVTGTVSIVVNKPHTDNKIMNSNYHSNIKIMNKMLELEENERKALLEQQLNTEGSRSGSSKKIKVTVNELDEGRMKNASVMKSGGLEGSAWQRIQNMNFSQNASGMSMMRFMRNASRYSMSVRRGKGSSMGESMAGQPSNKQMPPKPEPLTDKQILKRLNEEVGRSRIFKKLNVKKLPERIIRRQEVDKNLFKKKKKRELNKVEDESLGDDEGSGDEEAEAAAQKKGRRVDYFLDKNVDGKFHISMARNAAFKRHKDRIEWSGQDIIVKLDPYKARMAVTRLNDIRVWPYAVHGFIKKRRVLLKWFMNSPLVEHGMTICVLGNTVVLSLDYYGATPPIVAFNTGANTFFTLIFAFEMGLRITAIGPGKWLADKMNYMDGTIVMLSLIELIFMSGKGALSALRAVRIFRVFRVLRVARLLRGLKSMVQIINVISRSISSFIYLAMLLMLFIFIYALLGMQVFGGAFTDPEVVGTVRYNFDSFNNAFITSFILLTTENWNTVMFYAFSSTINQFLIALFFVSCIFIGNWMLLNLFLAILLDSFTAVEEEDMMTPEKKEAIKNKMLEDLKMKEGEDFIEGMDELQKEGFTVKSEKKPKKKKKKRRETEKSKQEPIKQPQQGNIFLESQEVDLQELARRDQELLEQRKQLFRGVECEMSCYVFSKKNALRVFCYKVINHQKFETFIMFLIVGSSFKLVFDTYTSKLAEDDPMVVYSSYFDLIFQAFFTCEMLIKICAFGFVMDENSYLTEAWNKLDCFIVVSGLIDTFMTGVDIPVIKILRLLRILRPLRFVSHSSSMKTLIEALMASMGSILNVGVVIVVVFLMFAILGVNLFAGKLQSCSVNYYLINTQEECFRARGAWTTYQQNMDNVVKAMLTLFVVSNNEGWPDVMYMYCDATGVETGPKPGAGILNAYFFIFFVFVGSFFFMNLFVGVLFLNFEKAQRDEKDAMLLDGDEIKWVDMMKMICSEKPEIIKIPKNPISRWCYEFVKDESHFANFIMACIILNIFTMAANFEGQSDAYSAVLEKINYFFTGAFATECAVKLVANGAAYFNSGWNKFDFFVVSASFLDIVMANMSGSSLKVIRVGPQLARIMRVMRVSRLFKLLNKYKGLQALMQTITFSMPSVINAFALLTLVYFIFSVLAVFFFKNIISGSQLDPDYMNFSNFSMALVMMLRLSTGEDWPSVMYDTMNVSEDCIPDYNCGTSYAPAFFMMFVLIQQYIMVNLFILIILQQFDLYYLPDDNVLDRFKQDVTNFKYVWRRFSAEFEGFKIRSNDVQKFFKDLKGDLGMSNEKDQRAIDRNLVIMNIQADDDGFIYFNELLYKTMKRRYAPGRTKKKILFEVELQTLEKLEKIMTQQIFQSRKKERQKAVAVNPFLSMMYKNMSFNVWMDIYHQNKEKSAYHMQLGLEQQISDDEIDEEEQNESKFVYETEDDEIIDEYDAEYLEHIAQVEAEKADPGPQLIEGQFAQGEDLLK